MKNPKKIITKFIAGLSLISLVAGGIKTSYSQNSKLPKDSIIDLKIAYQIKGFPGDALFYGINKFYPEEKFSSSSRNKISLKLDQKASDIPTKGNKFVWGADTLKVPYNRRNVMIHEFYHYCNAELYFPLVKISENEYILDYMIEGTTEFLAGLTAGYVDSYKNPVQELIIAIDSKAFSLEDLTTWYFLGNDANQKCDAFMRDYRIFRDLLNTSPTIKDYLKFQEIDINLGKLTELKEKNFFE